jgi:hypothetical protein
MQVKIRPMNWEKKASNGIPKDASDIMEYFNRALDKKAYPYVPRFSKITPEEIMNFWYPSRKQNINFVAESANKIIGAGTITIDSSSNKYSKDSKRASNEYALTIDPDYIQKGVGTLITKAIIKEAKKRV